MHMLGELWRERRGRLAEVRARGGVTIKLLLVLITETFVAEDPLVKAAVNIAHI